MIQTRLVLFEERIWLYDTEATEALQNSQSLLKDWRDCVRQFTSQIWPQNVLNEWSGDPLVMREDFVSLEKLIERVNFTF